MSRSEGYNTRQKDQVLAVIKKQKNGFSAKAIYEALDRKIGLTTIYRFVEKLSNEGVLLKINMEDNTSVYQYVEPCHDFDHFYLKCEKCGKLEHVDCEKVKGLTEHIYNEHHFKLSAKHIIISGLCAECTA
jgi:Fur family ferric uptake transcriptional regulator